MKSDVDRVAVALFVVAVFCIGMAVGTMLLSPAEAGEPSPWRAVQEQQRQIDSLTKRVHRLETLPTAQREERKRREEEERR